MDPLADEVRSDTCVANLPEDEAPCLNSVKDEQEADSEINRPVDSDLQFDHSDDGAQFELNEMIESLCSYTLNQLSLETNRIKGLKNQHLLEKQQLTVANCESIIKTSECLGDINNQLNSIAQPCEEIVESVGCYCDSITSFSEEAQATSKRWKESSRLLAKYSTITELLEIPTLIETSIKNGHYDESLKLHLYIKKLSSSKYLSDIPILKQLTYQCENLITTLASKLLRDLRSNLQLPLCLKIVSQLRKLDLFSETEIRIKFLTARDAWFQSLMADIPSSPPLLHLSKLIESARINLFDIATQYQAVFTSPSISTVSVSRSSPMPDVSGTRILSSWLLCKTEMILYNIKKDLKDAIADDPTAPVESVRDLILYFGQSMSRIGMEIRPRLINYLAMQFNAE